MNMNYALCRIRLIRYNGWNKVRHRCHRPGKRLLCSAALPPGWQSPQLWCLCVAGSIMSSWSPCLPSQFALYWPPQHWNPHNMANLSNGSRAYGTNNLNSWGTLKGSARRQGSHSQMGNRQPSCVVAVLKKNQKQQRAHQDNNFTIFISQFAIVVSFRDFIGLWGKCQVVVTIKGLLLTDGAKIKVHSMVHFVLCHERENNTLNKE